MTVPQPFQSQGRQRALAPLILQQGMPGFLSGFFPGAVPLNSAENPLPAPAATAGDKRRSGLTV